MATHDSGTIPSFHLDVNQSINDDEKSEDEDMLSSSQSSHAVTKQQRLYDAWQQLNTNSRDACRTKIDEVINSENFDELTQLCRVAFMRSPPVVKSVRSGNGLTQRSTQVGRDVVSKQDMASKCWLVVRRTLALLLTDKVSEDRAGEIVQIFKSNLNLLGDEELVAVIGIVLQSLISNNPTKSALKILQLLPSTFIQIRQHPRLGTSKLANPDLSSDETPESFQKWFVKQLVRKPFAAQIITHFTEQLAELHFEAEQNNEIVKKLLYDMSTLGLESEIPGIVYQVCLIRKLDKRMLWTSILELFSRLEARDRASPDSRSSQSSQETRLRPPGNFSRRLLQCEASCLVFLSVAISQDAFLGEVLIYIVGNREVDFTPFTFAALLAMATIQRFVQKNQAFLHKFILDELTQRMQQTESIGLRNALTSCADLHSNISQTFNAVLHNCGTFDQCQPSLVKLGLVLIDTKLVAAKATSAQTDSISVETFDMLINHEYRTAQVNAVNLGGRVLHTLFYNAPACQRSIVEELLSRLRLATSALAAVCVLRQIFETGSADPSMLLLEFNRGWMEAIDRIAELPISVSVPFVDAMLLLVRPQLACLSEARQVATHLHSYLLMAIKKAVFLPSNDSRLFACLGLISFIRSALGGKPQIGGPSQSSSSMASQSSPIDHRLVLECLAMIRRSLSSEASVRSRLYTELSSLFTSYPIIRAPILAMLLPHFLQYYSDNEDAVLPFRLAACTRSKQIVEPIDVLVQTVVHCLMHPDVENLPHLPGVDDEDSESLESGQRALLKLRACMIDVTHRLKSLTLKEMDINPEVPISAIPDSSKQELLHGLFQSALVYTMRTAARQIDDQTWQNIMDFFTVFHKIDQWVTGEKNVVAKPKAKPKEKKKAAPKTKKKADFSQLGSEHEETESDTDSEVAVVRLTQSSRNRAVAQAAVAALPKRKVGVRHLLPAGHLVMMYQKLLSRPATLGSREVEFQRWLVASTQSLFDETYAKGAKSNVGELGKLARCLFVYATRLFESVVKDEGDAKKKSTDKEKAVKSRSLFSLTLRVLAHCFEQLSHSGQAVMNDVSRTMLPKANGAKLIEIQNACPTTWSAALQISADIVMQWIVQLLLIDRLPDADAATQFLESVRRCAESDLSEGALHHREELAVFVQDALKQEIKGANTVRSLILLVLNYCPNDTDCLEFAENLARDLWLVLGFADDKRANNSRQLVYKSVSEKTSAAVVSALCHAVFKWIEDAEILFQRVKQLRRSELDMGADLQDSRAKNADTITRADAITSARHRIEQATYNRLSSACTVIDLLSQTGLQKREVEDLARTTTKAFKLLNVVALQVAANGPKTNPQLNQLIRFCLSHLAVHTSLFLQHASTALSKEIESEIRVTRGRKLLPDLTYALSTFETAVIRLSKSGNANDFTMLIRRSKPRDFRLDKVSIVMQDDDDDDGQEDEQQSSAPQRRAAKSPKKAARPSKPVAKPATKAKTAVRPRSSSSSSNEEEEDDENDYRGHAQQSQKHSQKRKIVHKKPAVQQKKRRVEASSEAESENDDEDRDVQQSAEV